jgi:hypothetical protein
MAKAIAETGRARAGRLLRETRCECGELATESRPKRNGSGRYEHFCSMCYYGLPVRRPW